MVPKKPGDWKGEIGKKSTPRNASRGVILYYRWLILQAIPNRFSQFLSDLLLRTADLLSAALAGAGFHPTDKGAASRKPEKGWVFAFQTCCQPVVIGGHRRLGLFKEEEQLD